MGPVLNKPGKAPGRFFNIVEAMTTVFASAGLSSASKIRQGQQACLEIGLGEIKRNDADVDTVDSGLAMMRVIEIENYNPAGQVHRLETAVYENTGFCFHENPTAIVDFGSCPEISFRKLI